MMALTAGGELRAATYTVTTLDDDGVGSLRRAIFDANANPGPDTIVFAVSNGAGTIALRTGVLTVSDDVTIDGSTQPGMMVSGRDASRVFTINSPATVEIIALTIRDGSSSLGGGISNAGTLTLTRCIVRENNSSGVGGGILNIGGTLTLERSTVTANAAASDSGGGIFNNAGTVTLVESTMTANTARFGGAVANLDTLVLTRSTVSGNTSAVSGGGIFSRGTVNLTNSTVSLNGAGTASGGGLANDGGTVTITSSTLSGNTSGLAGGGVFTSGVLTLRSSIIANSAGGDCFSVGTVHDLGFNIVENGGCVSHATSTSGDPGLGPLTNNGGPTLTHALLPGSIAIDAGSCSGGGVGTDQRGIARPQGFACDIGAFEVEVACPPDLNGDGVLDFFDLQLFLNWFAQGDPRADLAPDGVLDFFDLQAFLNAFAGGCA